MEQKKQKKPITKRWWFWLIVVMVALRIIVGPGEKEGTQEVVKPVDEGELEGEKEVKEVLDKRDEESPSSSEDEALFLTVDAKFENEEVVVSGKTNLIDGVKVMITLYDPNEVILSQDSPSVRNGKFTSTLGSRDKFRNDTYTINVSYTSIGENEKAQEKYGKSGEKLSEFDIVDGFLEEGIATTLVNEVKLEINNANMQEASKNLSKASVIHGDINTLYMDLKQVYNENKKSFNEVGWASYSRDFNAKIENIRNDIETSSIDGSIKIHLGSASAYLDQVRSEYSKELQGRGDVIIKKDMEKILEEELNNAMNLIEQKK